MMVWQEKAGARYCVLSLVLLLELMPRPPEPFFPTLRFCHCEAALPDLS